MPPVNTPTLSSPSRAVSNVPQVRHGSSDADTLSFLQRSPSRPQTPLPTSTRPLTPLSYLSSPAPDLAATLHTSHTAEQADDANVAFLRDSVDLLDSLPASTSARAAHADVERDPRRAEYRHTEIRGMSAAQGAMREATEEVSAHRERLQRIAARLNRRSGLSTSSEAAGAYGNRTPSPNRQSLYDWAPATGETEEAQEVEGPLANLVDLVRQQRQEISAEDLRWLEASEEDARRQRQGDGARAASASEAVVAEHRRIMLRASERRRRETEWVNLRSRAMAQRARQEGEGSPSSTERMLRYVMERERSGLSEEEERARGAGWVRPSPVRGERTSEEIEAAAVERRSTRPYVDPRLAVERQREQERHERVAAFRRGHLAENVLPRLQRISTPAPPPVDTKPSLVENALRYLSDLRFATSYEDSLSTAIEHGLATKEWFADKHDEFITDLSELPPVQESSWLQPGAVFEGQQHATTTTANLTHQPPTNSRNVEQINPNYRPSPGPTLGFDHPPGSTHISNFSAARPWLSHPGPRASAPKETHDSWPVRVTLHAIDHDKMTLQGTMEAYDVPQHPSSLNINHPSHTPSSPTKAGKKHAPITTFLEGEIVDFKTHSFLTPNVGDRKKRKSGPHDTTPENRTPYTTIPTTLPFPPATPAQDASNWLRLPPFSTLAQPTTTSPTPPSPDTALATLLLTLPSLTSILESHIFMRWKERCFVHAPNDPCTSSEQERGGDRDKGHGLTISGFYYVSLRRSDGRCEGIYFDPVGGPVQWVGLEGRSMGAGGAWSFR